MAELAAAPTGIIFGQLLRGDVDGARKEMKKNIKSTGRERVMLYSASTTQRRLKLVPVKVLGTKA